MLTLDAAVPPPELQHVVQLLVQAGVVPLHASAQEVPPWFAAARPAKTLTIAGLAHAAMAALRRK